MSLFCEGIVPNSTRHDMMELRCHLDLVVSKYLDELLGFWAGPPGISTKEDRFKLLYNANQLATTLSMAARTAESIRNEVRRTASKGGD